MIGSGVQMLIYFWKDLASGNFITQMSVSAPVPATTLKKDTDDRRLAVDVWAEVSVHHQHHLINCSYPLFFWFTEKNGILKKSHSILLTKSV